MKERPFEVGNGSSAQRLGDFEVDHQFELSAVLEEGGPRTGAAFTLW
jgi:hypothetical protein